MHAPAQLLLLPAARRGRHPLIGPDLPPGWCRCTLARTTARRPPASTCAQCWSRGRTPTSGSAETGLGCLGLACSAAQCGMFAAPGDPCACFAAPLTLRRYLERDPKRKFFNDVGERIVRKAGVLPKCSHAQCTCHCVSAAASAACAAAATCTDRTACPAGDALCSAHAAGPPELQAARGAAALHP